MTEIPSSHPTSFQEYCQQLSPHNAEIVAGFLVSNQYCQIITKAGLEELFITLIFDPYAQDRRTKSAKAQLVTQLVQFLYPSHQTRSTQLDVGKKLSVLADIILTQSNSSDAGRIHRANPRGSSGNVFPEGI